VAATVPAAPAIAANKPEPMTNPAIAPQDAAPERAGVEFQAPELYLNHELSALEFNSRVLAKARTAAGTAAFPVHFRAQPRRILQGARGQPQALDRLW
jgi:hypothetical protein